MKHIIKINSVILLLVCGSCFAQGDITQYNNNVYEVIRIDTIYDAYLVQIERFDEGRMCFSIVVLKDIVSLEDLKRIKQGQKYILDFKLYEDTYFIPPIYAFMIGDIKIYIPEKKRFGQIAFSDLSKWVVVE
ncbi:MAG: hypothetical protein LBL74_04565 [Bacteroidales bacterium]|jgi:hypothetical protein|nr:hypothetical protein [Bacteroidales bacterium]